MPTYDYRCTQCGEVMEVIHSIHHSPEIRCPKCDAEMHRLISGGCGIIFKGTPGQSGFYSLDYGRQEAWKKEDREIADAKKKVRALREAGEIRESWDGDTVSLNDAKKL